VPVPRWPSAEAASSAASSASCYHLKEKIWIIPLVEPELKFVQVERQIGLTYLVIRPDDAALEQRPESFNRVCMNDAAHVFATAVADDFVRQRFRSRAEQSIAAMFIARNQFDPLLIDHLTDEAIQRPSIGVLYHLADHLTFASNSADDGDFASGPAPDWRGIFSAVAIVRLAANVGFVHFHVAEQTLHIRIGHSSADTNAHIPSRAVITALDLPMDLQSADPLLGLRHQVDDLKPSRERVIRVLEYRLGDDAESIAIASAAILVFANPVKRLGRKQVNFRALAARTFHAIGPSLVAEQGLTSVLIAVLLDDFGERNGRLSGERLPGFNFTVHEEQYSDFLYECQA
jgi:hypothetical protein